jgi:hypothetical protein
MKKSAGMMLLAFLFIAPGNAQQPDADEAPAVPDNIAPHTAPAQPLPYSHKTHVALGLVCQTCHTNPDPGSLMTYPAIEMCVSCHLSVATDKSAIAELHEFAASGQNIPWVRVYTVTPGVTWNHRAHLVSGTQCETCHGDIGQTEAVSESKAILAMASCISCHEARGARTECVTCHVWPTDQFLGIK